MRVSDVFAGDFYKAEDFDRPAKLTIESVKPKKFDDGDKFLIRFRETNKCLVANKTNCDILAEMFGDETDDWEGRQIVLQREMVPFKGKRVPAVRVRTRPLAEPERKAKPEVATKPITPREPGDDDEAFDDRF